MTGRLLDLLDPSQVRRDAGGRSVGLFCRELPAAVSRATVAQLQRLCQESGKNIRLCLHESPEADFHTMIICERRGGYYPPHSHLQKGECFQILDGARGVFQFGPEGELLDACRLTPDGVFMYRVAVGGVHAVLPLTEMVTYHESKPGPFLGAADSIAPSWAPDPADMEQTAAFTARLLARLVAGC